jgi:hypothetical protein
MSGTPLDAVIPVAAAIVFIVLLLVFISNYKEK